MSTLKIHDHAESEVDAQHTSFFALGALTTLYFYELIGSKPITVLD